MEEFDMVGGAVLRERTSLGAALVLLFPASRAASRRIVVNPTRLRKRLSGWHSRLANI